MNDTMVKVLVVDGHSTFAELLIDAIDRERDLVSVGHATTGAAAVAMYAELRPDVVLMDLHLPDMDGFVASSHIVAMSSDARVILLTANVTQDAMVNAAQSGVCGLVAKDGQFAGLVDNLRTAKPGSLAVDPAVVTGLTDQKGTANRALRRPLLRQELAVLDCMADGRDVTDIARVLGISGRTCKGLVASVLSTLGARTQLEAVITAVRIGLVQLSDEAANAQGF